MGHKDNLLSGFLLLKKSTLSVFSKMQTESKKLLFYLQRELINDMEATVKSLGTPLKPAGEFNQMSTSITVSDDFRQI